MTDRASAPPFLECPKTPPRTSANRPAPKVLQSTPIHNRLSGARLFTSKPKIKADENRTDMFTETRNFFLGPMPVDEFLDAFLPPIFTRNTRNNGKLGGLDFEVKKEWKHELHMYGPLITALNKLKTGLHFRRTSAKGDPNWLIENLCTDISAYFDPNVFRTDFSKMDLLVELKRLKKRDPFRDPADGANLSEHEFLKSDNESQDIIGQICAYATAQMGMTFRTHCFSVFIADDTARLIRWDRAGAVVTRSFKYTKEHYLVTFLRRYAKSSICQRGWDLTATPLSLEPEAKKARDALTQQRFNGETEDEFQERSEYFRTTRIFKFLVPVLQAGQATGLVQMKKYIGAFPRRWACSLLGRNSRGTPVWDPDTERIHWLKDTWRIDMKSIAAEHISYHKMEQCGVQNLIPVIAAGDVRELDARHNESNRAVHADLKAFHSVVPSDTPNATSEPEQKTPVRGPVYNTVHCTVTDKLIDEDWVCGDKKFFRANMVGYSHYKLVLELVGRDLTSFPSTTILLRAVADSLLCHGQALFKADILHRDISPGNVLIMDDGSGKLIDWDLCRHGEQGQSHRPGRTGTWQFISGMLLKHANTKIHEYPDDLESFLHTLVFTLARFSSSSLGPDELLDFLAMFDEEKPGYNGETRGGKLKCALLQGEGGYVDTLDFPGRPGLRKLLLDFSLLFWPIYTLKEKTEAMEKEVEMLSTFEGGGQKIREMILRLLEQAGDWEQDPRSEKVDLPRNGKRTRVERVPFQPFSFGSTTGFSGTLDPVAEGNENDPSPEEDEEEDRRPKRIRSDVNLD